MPDWLLQSVDGVYIESKLRFRRSAMNFIKKLFCKHKNSEVICWHWTHGPNGNDIRYLEIQRKCSDCGRFFFSYIENRNDCEKFVSKYPDKQWSNKCKPVL
jgi:hypothetical protein